MSNNLKGHGAALLAVCIYGISSQAYSTLRSFFTPIEIFFAGILCSCLLLNLIYLPRLQQKKLTGELWYIIAGALGVALYFYLEYTALSKTSKESFSVILTVVPIVCSVACRLLLKAGKNTASFFSGFGFAFVGIFLINYFKHGSCAFTVWGVIYALIAAVCLGCFFAVLKRLTNMGATAVQIVRRVFFWGVIFLIPLCFFMDFDIKSYAQLTDIKLLFNMLFAGVATPSLCYVGLTYAIRHLGTAKASVYTYAVPVVSILIYAFVNNAGICSEVLLGTVLTVVGLTVSLR